MGGQRPFWARIYDLPLRYKIVGPVVLLEVFVFLAAMQVTTSSVRTVADQSMHAEARSRLRLLGAAYLQMTLTGEQEYLRELVSVVSRSPDVAAIDLRPVEGRVPSDSVVERPDGLRLYTVWQRVQVFGDATDIGISFTDRAVVLAVNDARTRYAWILGVGALLTTVVLWIMILAITDPIGRVAESAGRLAAGERPLRYEISRRDEVGTLAHAFDTMAVELRNAQQQLEDLLAERTHRLDAMFHNLGVGVLHIDADRTIRAVNPAMAAMIGSDSDEIIGQKCFALFEQDIDTCAGCVLSNPDHLVSRHTCTLHRGSSGERVLETTVVRVPSTGGRPPTVMELAHDVTEERRLQAQLLQSSKLASIGQLASGLAHEINNPLGTILLRTDSLLADIADYDLPEDLQDDVEAIRRQASRVNRITEELLTFSRCSTAQRQAVRPAEIVESATILVGMRAEKRGVAVRSHLEGSLPAVEGNKTQLEQVVVNLLTNAIDASAPDTVVTVGVQDGGGSGSSAAVEFWVEDHGEGIPEDKLEMIYDPFYSTKDVGEGTGLGLSISYGIVSAHEGTIDVSSVYGEGTVVRVRVPIHVDSRRNDKAVAA